MLEWRRQAGLDFGSMRMSRHHRAASRVRRSGAACRFGRIRREPCRRAQSLLGAAGGFAGVEPASGQSLSKAHRPRYGQPCLPSLFAVGSAC
jgi:hypothetical protein